MWSVCLAYVIGDCDAAYAHAQASLQLAERIGDAFSRVYAWYWLGLAEGLRGEWARSRDALERSRSLARERRTATDSEGFRLAVLAEAHLGLDEPKVARRLARQGLDTARAAGAGSAEMFASVIFARVAVASQGEQADEEVAAELRRALELSLRTEARALEPLIRTELAELARRRGDDDARERELREAQRIFEQLGASDRAANVARELEPLRS